MVREVTDSDTLAMVRQTSRDVFTGVPTSRTMSDLGWYGLFTPEDVGGSGWRPVEACAVAEQAGAAYSPSSWAESAIAACALSALSSTRHLVDSVLCGQTTATFSTGRMTIGTSSVPRVSGVFPFSPGLPAGVLIVVSEDGTVGAAVEGNAGVSIEEQTDSLDTTRSFHCLRLHDAEAVPIEPGQLAWLTTTAQMLSCADTVGALGKAIEVVTTHLVERQAFGSPLASFQVIQHRLVDLSILHASAQALVYRAAEAIEQKSDGSLVDATHVFLSARAIPALEDCIQLAGGMGFTWEFPIHHALRRVLTNCTTIRTPRRSSDRLATSRGWSR
jgi:alkylation response protein AidB-like acyl-CoA dehydrogenase